MFRWGFQQADDNLFLPRALVTWIHKTFEEIWDCRIYVEDKMDKHEWDISEHGVVLSSIISIASTLIQNYPPQTYDMSLSHFRDLASNDETVRLKAAYSLLSELSSGSTEAIEYALNRLIRGLASGRESSRIGFSVALTEVGIPL
jgi:hypothetical protein